RRERRTRDRGRADRACGDFTPPPPPPSTARATCRSAVFGPLPLGCRRARASGKPHSQAGGMGWPREQINRMTPVNLSWPPPVLAQAPARLTDNRGELAGGATVWLAVTGLSRSGKTVFITSLIHNLLSSLHNPNRMPLLGVVGERRLIAAGLEGAREHQLAQFPYLRNIEKMASPDWPERTADISEIGIELRFAPAGTLGTLLSEITGSPASLTVRIVDYPGEWLLDLPLLAQSYAEWSRGTLQRLRRGVHAEIARDFLA